MLQLKLLPKLRFLTVVIFIIFKINQSQCQQEFDDQVVDNDDDDGCLKVFSKKYPELYCGFSYLNLNRIKRESPLDPDNNETINNYPNNYSTPEQLLNEDTNFTTNSTTLSSDIYGYARAEPSSYLKTFDQYLPPDYNKLEIPFITPNESTYLPEDNKYNKFIVWISLNIRSVLEVDELKETLNLQMESVVSWFDSYIAQNNKDINESITKPLDLLYLDSIWKPDLYMEDLVKMNTPKYMGEPISLRLRPSLGEVFYKSRLSPVVKCRMTFVYYPADTQKCHFILRSYSYQSQDLALHWLREVQLQENMVANFELFIETLPRSNMTEQFDLLNITYDTIQFTIIARRKLSYHLIQTYLPSWLFIMITWFCFLLPSSMLEARMGISMTTLLTLTAMFASVRGNAPVVSYVKAIDIWMAGCICFVFMTLAEFTTMIWIRNMNDGQNDKCKKSTDDDFERNKLLGQHENHIGTPEKIERAASGSGVKYKATDNKNQNQQLQLCQLIGNLIDQFASVAYSISFVIFTIIYWSWLLVSAEYFESRQGKSLNYSELNYFIN